MKKKANFTKDDIVEHLVKKKGYSKFPDMGFSEGTLDGPEYNASFTSFICKVYNDEEGVLKKEYYFLAKKNSFHLLFKYFMGVIINNIFFKKQNIS